MERGVLYITANDAHLDFARRSAQSVKVNMPDIPTMIISDADSPGEMFDHQLEMDSPSYSFSDKVQNLHRTLFKKTVFLDADTSVTEDFLTLFTLLEDFDIAAAHSFTGQAHPQAPHSFAERNTGVLAYRNIKATDRLFQKWRDLHETDRKAGRAEDQPSFRRALFSSNISYCTLRREYNCHTSYGGFLVGPARIIHGQHQNVEEIASRLNSTTEPRVFTNIGGDVYVIEGNRSTVLSTVLSLERYGIRKTLLRALNKLLGLHR